MQNINLYYDKGDMEKAESIFTNIPSNITYSYGVYLPAATNIFINDSQGKVDSFSFLASLIYLKQERYLEIWEADYLTAQLADNLVANLPDISDRTIYALAGCGVEVANMLQKELQTRYGIQLAWGKEAYAVKPLVIDDVIKTGRTIWNNIPQAVVTDPNTAYATWAIPAVSYKALAEKGEYRALNTLLAGNQQLFTSVCYAGEGVSSLGLPVNSISTFLPLFADFVGDEYWQIPGDAKAKAQQVTASLGQKYFGEGAIEFATRAGLEAWFSMKGRK